MRPQQKIYPWGSKVKIDIEYAEYLRRDKKLSYNEIGSRMGFTGGGVHTAMKRHNLLDKERY